MNYGYDYNNNGGGGTPGGGGGFNSGGGSGYSNTSGGGSNTKPRRSYDEQTMIPVTIGMCLGAVEQDGNASLPDGRSLYHVRLVASVRSFEDFSTSCVYTVEDGTGLMEIKQWADADQECTSQTELRQRTLKDHLYIKIVGQIKIYDGKKMVVAESIKPLASGNELTHHMLEVVYSGQLFQHKDRIVAPAMMMNNHQPMMSSSSSTTHAISMNNSNSNESQQRVLEFIQQCHSEQGVTIEECAAATGVPMDQVRNSISHMSDEGSLYTTIDEFHYKYA